MHQVNSLKATTVNAFINQTNRHILRSDPQMMIKLVMYCYSCILHLLVTCRRQVLGLLPPLKQTLIFTIHQTTINRCNLSFSS